jgi:transposase
MAQREFQFVPLWGIAVFLLYSIRRVNCRRCGVHVELVPWAEGKRRTTISFEWFLAIWARRLSWTEVAQIFGTSWETVFRSVIGVRPAFRTDLFGVTFPPELTPEGFAMRSMGAVENK